MRVGATEAERTHGGAPRRAGGVPISQFRIDVKGCFGKCDFRIRGREMQARRNLFVRQRENRLDQSGNPCRRIEMADVGLH